MQSSVKSMGASLTVILLKLFSKSFQQALRDLHKGCEKIYPETQGNSIDCKLLFVGKVLRANDVITALKPMRELYRLGMYEHAGNCKNMFLLCKKCTMEEPQAFKISRGKCTLNSNTRDYP